MKNIIKISFLFLVLFISSCVGGNKDDALIAVVLTEVYFMEKEFGVKECDNFYYNSEIIGRLKNIDPLITDEVLKEAFELRKEKSNEYNR